MPRSRGVPQINSQGCRQSQACTSCLLSASADGAASTRQLLIHPISTRSLRMFSGAFPRKTRPGKSGNIACSAFAWNRAQRTNERDTPKVFCSDRIEAGAEISKRSSLSIQEMLARHIAHTAELHGRHKQQKSSIHLNFNSRSISWRVPPQRLKIRWRGWKTWKYLCFPRFYFGTQALLRVLVWGTREFMLVRRQKIVHKCVLLCFMPCLLQKIDRTIRMSPKSARKIIFQTRLTLRKYLCGVFWGVKTLGVFLGRNFN